MTVTVTVWVDSANMFWFAESDQEGDANAIRVVVGGLVGVFAALAMGTLFIYARKDPQKFKKYASSFLFNEVQKRNACVPVLEVSLFNPHMIKVDTHECRLL